MSSDGALPEGAVRFHRVTKQYALDRRAGAWQRAQPGRRGELAPDGTTAVDDVTIEIAPGSTVGFIGPNGAGKSTLLKMLANITSPTAGEVRHTGRLGSMIELGLGFHPDLTGWENLRVGASVLGLSRGEFRSRASEIVAFADLADAMDTPVKRYSTGMVARLGFALATHVDAAILAVDEVLAVGDREFQERCLDHVAKLVAGGTTLLFVSHEMALVDIVCERVVRLESGRIVDDGPSTEVIESYLGRPPTTFVDGDPGTSIRSLRLLKENLDPRDPTEIDLEVEVRTPPRRPTDLVTELFLPSLLPGVPIAHHRAPAPADLTRPGIHRVAGRSSDLPWSGGHLRVEVSLREGVRSLLSKAHADFRVAGTRRVVKPMYLLDPHVSLTPFEYQGPAGHRRRVSTDDVVAELRSVTKTYRPGKRRASGRAALPGSWGRTHGEALVALDQVDLSLLRGQVLGVVGPNGAGKSTLLKAIAGLIELDSGTVQCSGRVIALLELGLGFHADMTGRENTYLSALLLGMDRAAVDDRLDDILAFADIGPAIDQPVKRYSTGMRARLGFALAAHIPADVILIDELLAVGDQTFRNRAAARVRDLADAGASIVFVSHNHGLVAQVCDQTIVLDRGRITDDGSAAEVIERFGGAGWSAGPAIGSGAIRLHSLKTKPSAGTDGNMGFSCEVEVTEPSPHVRLELSLRDPNIADRLVTLTRDEVEMATMGVAVLLEAGKLPDPGWYELQGGTGPVTGSARVDLTITAIDDRDGDAIAEVWQTVHVGQSSDDDPVPRISFDMSWSAVQP